MCSSPDGLRERTNHGSPSATWFRVLNNTAGEAGQSAGVCWTRLQTWGDDELMGAVDRDLSVVAGNHRLGTQRLNTAIRISEIALRPIGRAAVGTPLWFAALHHARGRARSVLIVGGRLLGLGFEEGFGGADALEPCRFVGDPVGHLIAALIASVGTVLRPYSQKIQTIAGGYPA